jgi:putative hydrolase of HD superfamily
MADSQQLNGILEFIRQAEALKDTLRTGYTRQGRRESTAEHSWRLCLLAMVLAEHLADIDLGRLLQLCVVHDLAEAIYGDVPAVAQHDYPDKTALERSALNTLLAPLPESTRKHLATLWEEYEAADTLEARSAKALDKLETLIQHTQGANPADFDYAFNLTYGRRYTDADPLFAALRSLVDEQTRQRMD